MMLPPTQSPTIFAAIAFLSTLLVTYLADRLPEAPKGPDVDQAWADLHTITRRPHPYNSHENDVVRNALLSALVPLAQQYAHIEILDDSTNVTYFDNNVAAYFEGANVLVKIDPVPLPEDHLAEDDISGLLISAHFDSVSTGVGATDDGMGTVTLLAIARFLARHPLRRARVVLNLNNGEEDGLNGAMSFLVHPWAKLVDHFVNLEGSGAGGPPIFFRTTSKSAIDTVASAYMDQKRGTSLTSDAFKSGAIRSRTDFSVYETGGLEGVDLAFYRRRARYHSKYDAIPFLVDGKRSLYSMMDATLGVVDEFERKNSEAHSESTEAVYFSVLNRWMVVFDVRIQEIASWVLPLLGGAVLVYLQSLDKREPLWLGLQMRTFQFFFAFFAPLVATLAACIGLAYSVTKINPFIVYAHPDLLFATHFVLAQSVFHILRSKTVYPPAPVSRPWTVIDRAAIAQYDFDWRQTGLIQSFVFMCLLLVGGVVARTGTGIHLILGWTVSLLMCMGLRAICGEISAVSPTVAKRRPAKNGKVKAIEKVDGVAQKRLFVPLAAAEVLQAAFSTIPPLLLLLPILDVAVHAMTHTLSDGSSAILVHAAIALLAVLFIIPGIPYISPRHCTSPKRFMIPLALILLSISFILASFPFSMEVPFKVFFQQVVDVSDYHHPKIFTEITGVQPWVQEVVRSLPSATGVDCTPASDRLGTEVCRWETVDPPSFSFLDVIIPLDNWVETHVEHTGDNSATFWIRGEHSRNCRIYFDDAQLVNFNVRGAESTKQATGYGVTEKGAGMLVLFSRTWGKEWVVDVTWNGTLSEYSSPQGRIACEWSEYASGRVGGVAAPGTELPSFEEAVGFAPSWVAISKRYHGLLEVWRRFEF